MSKLLGMNNSKKIIQGPPWLVHLLTPMVARLVAREMTKKYPHLSASEIIAKMRADFSPQDEAGQQMIAAVERRLPSIPSKEIDPTTKITWSSPSSLMLIAANMLPLYGVLVLEWPIFPVMLLFWLENVTIGILNALRMLLVDPTDLALWAGKLFMVPFFCFHYGMFTAVHGVFVFALFADKSYDKLDHGLSRINSIMQAIHDYDLNLALIALAGSHLFSFVWNYLIRGQFRRAALTELMGRPYNRIIVLHITLILGGIIITALGSPVWALVLLIVLKINFDLKAHIKEHRKAIVAEPTISRQDTI